MHCAICCTFVNFNGVLAGNPAETPQLDDPLVAKRIPHECLIRLKGVFSSLKSAEYRVASYLVSQPGRIPECKVADVAKNAGCSEATVVRLARKLGYEGFQNCGRIFVIWSRDPCMIIPL